MKKKDISEKWGRIVRDGRLCVYIGEMHGQNVPGLMYLTCLESGGRANLISVHLNCTELYFDHKKKEFVVIWATKDCSGHNCRTSYGAKEIGRLQMGEKETQFAEKVAHWRNLNIDFLKNLMKENRNRVNAVVRAFTVNCLKNQLDIFGTIVCPPYTLIEYILLEDVSQILRVDSTTLEKIWRNNLECHDEPHRLTFQTWKGIALPHCENFIHRVPWWLLGRLKEELAAES